MAILIGLVGQIGSGKDTVADMIKEEFPAIEFEDKRYADVLKDIVCSLSGLTRTELEDRDIKESPLPDKWQSSEIKVITPRFMLQTIGEGIRNKVHKNAWVNATFNDYSSRASYWIVRDVRYQNEVDAITSRGGLIVRVVRPLSLRAPQLYSDYMSSNWRFFLKFNTWIRLFRRSEYKKYFHESELVDNLDLGEHYRLIFNTSTLEDLRVAVKELPISLQYLSYWF